MPPAVLFVLPCAAAPAESVVVCDLTPLLALDHQDPTQRRRHWDVAQLVVALQGLVNRDGPRLYLRYVADADDFWWARMTEPGSWLADRPVERIDDPLALLDRFGDAWRGLVVWDERVPATSNLAGTIAGCEDLLPVRWDAGAESLFARLTARGAKVVRNLRGDDAAPMFTGTGTIPGSDLPSTGSAKNDAYRWLIEQYLRDGPAEPRRLGYYLDGWWLSQPPRGAPELATLVNCDWVIAHRGVLFDLNVWDDEATIDDPTQPPGTDAETLKLLLRTCWERLAGEEMIHVAGFVPWLFKYTDHAGGRHEAVPTEWRYAEILSCHGAFMDADAIGLSAMANASFYQHYPLRERYDQPEPTEASLREAGLIDADGAVVPRLYLAHYVGDYDAAAWLYQQLPRMWGDPARGRVPLSWAFNPNLADRFPLGMAWAREHAAPGDRFIAGDSGAGYLNPGYLTEPRPHSGLPSGLAAWERHCAAYYRRWDLSVTGFVIDGFARGLSTEGLDAYARFSPGGIVAQKIDRLGLHGAMPYLRMAGDLPHDPAAAAEAVLTRGTGRGPRFAVWRSILKPPSWYAQVQDELVRRAGDELRTVDMPTLLALVARYAREPERYEPDAARYRALSAIAADPERIADLPPVWVNDGPFELATQAGEPCWRVPGHAPPYYLYFAVPDAFWRPGDGALEVDVVFWDGGAGEFAVQYDSSLADGDFDGAYHDAGLLVTRTGTASWRTATFRLAAPRLAGRQNGEADWRLYSRGDDLLVRSVAMRRAR